jgi:hypothetical protein
MTDVLANRSPAEVAAFYRRLADAVDRSKGSLSVSLAALLMRHWLDNRVRYSTFNFAAPTHLRAHPQVTAGLAYHRRVYLTEDQARIGGSTRWAGVLPRLQGRAPYPRWDGSRPLNLEYQGLIEMPLRYQVTGSDADRDLLYALHGFQLKTYVTVVARAVPRSSTRMEVRFQSFGAEVIDDYDWDYSEHLTVPNPDYQSTAAGAVTPGSDRVVVYHRNAKRIEDAGLAAPYHLVSNRWSISGAPTTSGEVDTTRRL